MSANPLSRERAFDDEPGPSAATGPAADELPPVRPPSAGFIVQLFVVPALIVLAIVGVIGLFGKLSESEQDWRALVQELGSANEHRRWRAALGLAYLLKADQELPVAERRLSGSPQVAQAIVTLLDRQLDKRSATQDDIKQQAFVARTLGLIDVPEIVLPALLRAGRPQHDLEVRKNALASIALIFGRQAGPDAAGDNGGRIAALVATPGLVEEIIEISHDSDALIRQLAAFTLGLAPAEESRHRLEVLLNDADPHTQENAALGLARQRSTAGWPVFRRLLAHASASAPAGGDSDPAAGLATSDERNAQAIQLVALKNSLKAVGDLSAEWTPSQRDELEALVRPLAEGHAEDRIRTDARQALLDLRREATPD